MLTSASDKTYSLLGLESCNHIQLNVLTIKMGYNSLLT